MEQETDTFIQQKLLNIIYRGGKSSTEDMDEKHKLKTCLPLIIDTESKLVNFSWSQLNSL